MADDDPLVDLVTEAEENSQRLSQTQKRQQQVKAKLREYVAELAEYPGIREDDVEDLEGMIDRGEYGRVRDRIDELRDEVGFSTEEKALLAEAFADALGDLDGTIDSIETALWALANETTATRSELVDYIYSNNTSLTKTAIRETLAVIDDYDGKRLSKRDRARIVARFGSDLNVGEAEAVIEALEDHRGDD